MKSVLRWVVAVPLGVIVVLFLIANRSPIALSFDPISTASPALSTPALPLWLWLIFFLFIGFFAGAAGMWVSDRELRVRAKADRLELKALKAAAAAKREPEPAPPADPTAKS